MYKKVLLSICLLLLPVTIPSMMIAQQHNDSVESTNTSSSDGEFDDESFFNIEEDFEQPQPVPQSSTVIFWLKRFGLRVLLLYEDAVLACKRMLSR